MSAACRHLLELPVNEWGNYGATLENIYEALRQTRSWRRVTAEQALPSVEQSAQCL